MRLVQVLAQRGLVSPAQLGSLLAHENAGDDQVVSYLIETGAISTDQVAQALSVLHGVPPALDQHFGRADAELRKRFPAHQAASLKAIPLFRTANRRVAVAMVDPTHPKSLEEIGFVLGAALDPMVISETAFHRQLEALYSMPTRKTASQSDSSATNRASSARQKATRTLEVAPVQCGDGRPAERIQPSRRRTSTPPAPARSKNPTLTYLPPVQEMPVFVPAGANESGAAQPEDDLLAPDTVRTPLPPMVTVTGSDSIVEQILAAPDHQAAADHLFAFMRSCFGAGAMFAVDGVFAAGRFGYNFGQPCPEVEHLVFSLSLPSCLRIAFNQGMTFHGAPPPEGESVHRPLWNALGCQTPKEVLVVPVVVVGTTAILLYAQGRSGSRIDQFTASRLECVCEAVANTLVRLSG